MFTGRDLDWKGLAGGSVRYYCAQAHHFCLTGTRKAREANKTGDYWERTRLGAWIWDLDYPSFPAAAFLEFFVNRDISSYMSGGDHVKGLAEFGGEYEVVDAQSI